MRDKLGAVTQPPVVAMIGGGQLARMTHQAAIALGQTLRVLSISAEESGSTLRERRLFRDAALSTTTRASPST